MTGTELAKSGFASIDLISGDNFERVERVATGLANSGVFKDVTNTQNAMAKILLGADLGLTPTQALMNLDVVEGNARVRSVLLAAWVRKHPDYDYRVTEHDAEHCVIEFTYKGEVAGTSAFSMEDARLAQLVKDHAKSAWRAHPRNMLWARAMSNGVRWYCPDLTGGVAVYTEADEFVDSSAVDITSGDGDGSEPGWSGLAEDTVAEIEAVLDSLEQVGQPVSRAVLQQKLSGRQEAAEAWLADTRDVLAMREAEKGGESS